VVVFLGSGRIEYSQKESTVKIQVNVLVREVRVIDKSKLGVPLPRPFQVVNMVDRDTGGDLQLNFPNNDCPYQPGQDVHIDATVKGRTRGYNVSYDVIGVTAVKK